MHWKCAIVHCMDAVVVKLATAIGARVRQERRGRKLTLDGLAKAAGVSRRMLVSVEQGTVNPSVGTLLRLSDALGVGLPALVEPPETPAVKVTRSGDGAELWTGQAGGRGVLLTGTAPPDVLELWDWTLEPGDQHVSDAHAEGTQEALVVLQGAISVDVAEETIDLQVGDAMTFPGDAAHRYRNDTSSPARFCLAVFEPGVGVPAARPESHS